MMFLMKARKQEKLKRGWLGGKHIQPMNPCLEKLAGIEYSKSYKKKKKKSLSSLSSWRESLKQKAHKEPGLQEIHTGKSRRLQ